MSYCIYLRKSRADLEAEERGEGETLERHKKILLNYADKKGLLISKIYEEIISGETISSRPIVQELLNDVDSGKWTGVLVVEVERLARGDTMDQGLIAQSFKYSNTLIITPNKTYDPNNEFDEEYFEFGLFMSRREYKTINRRLQTGRVLSVNEGKYVGNVPPYGYVRVKLKNEKGFILKPNDKEFPVVQYIYKLFTEGDISAGINTRVGASLIAKHLTSMQIKTRQGGNWSASTITDILKNETYTGKVRWNRRKSVKSSRMGEIIKSRPRSADYILVEGRHEAIVDTELFNNARDIFLKKKYAPAVNRRRDISNPLAGIIKCGLCGRSMVKRPYKDKLKPASLICTALGCSNVSSQFSLVEEQILSALNKRLGDNMINISGISLPNVTMTNDIIENALKDVESELCKTKKQLNNLYDLLEQGVYTRSKFEERYQIVDNKMKSLQDTVDKLTEKLKHSKKERGHICVENKLESFLSLYYSADSAAVKNNMIREILEKAVYVKLQRSNAETGKYNFELKLYPKI